MSEFYINPFWVDTFPWVLIAVWLFYSVLAVLVPWVRNLNYYIFESIPSTFVTLGLLGTFAGIAYGLSTFDTSPDLIKESIQKLLDGLKTAMYTTLMGVSLSLAFGKIIQWFVKGNYVEIPPSPELLELQALNESFKFYQTKTAAYQSSMIMHQKNALKEGLEEVLATFNDTMEGFIAGLVSENFKELTGAVNQLVDWQTQYREDMGGLIIYYRQLTEDNKELISNTETWISLIEQVAGQSSNLKKVINEFDEAFSEEGNLSKILTDIRKSTAELELTTSKFSSLATNLNDTTVSMQVTGDKIDDWTKSVTSVSDQSAQMVAAVSQLRTIDQEQLARMFASIDKLFITYIEDLEKRLAKIPEHAE